MSQENQPPASVKIGPLTYSIAAMPPREASSRGLYGHVMHSVQRIEIDQQHGAERSALSVLHEMLHGFVAVYSIELGDDKAEERIVGQMTTALGAAMRDSPEVFSWVLRSLRWSDLFAPYEGVGEDFDLIYNISPPETPKRKKRAKRRG